MTRRGSVLRGELGCLFQGGGTRDLFELGLDFVLLLADGFEEESSAIDVDVGFGDLPEGRSNLAAFHIKGATLPDAAKETEADADVLREAAADGDDTVLGFIDRKIAGQDAKNTGLHVWRMEVGVGLEVQGDVPPGFACDRPEKGIWQHLQKSVRALVIGLCVAV